MLKRISFSVLTAGLLIGFSFANSSGEGSGNASISLTLDHPQSNEQNNASAPHENNVVNTATQGSQSSNSQNSSPQNSNNQQNSQSNSENHFGGSAQCGPISISNCIVKPAQGKNTAAYGTFKQNSGQEDTLISASTPFAEKTEIHDMSMEGGIMKMNQLKDGIQIPANGQISFQPGGKHIMLIGVKSGFENQKEIPITLNFKHAGPTEVKFTVDPDAVKKFENAAGSNNSSNHAANSGSQPSSENKNASGNANTASGTAGSTPSSNTSNSAASAPQSSNSKNEAN